MKKQDEQVSLTIDEAFAAMYAFLQMWESLGPVPEVTELRTFLTLYAPRRTSDPALWDDWMIAIAQAKAGSVACFYSNNNGVLTNVTSPPKDTESQRE
jgi:hypothetical protein